MTAPDFGYVEPIGEKPGEFEDVKFAWRCYKSGTWGGWFSTKAEAIRAANPGAYIVEKRLSQRVCGTSEGGNNDRA